MLAGALVVICAIGTLLLTTGQVTAHGKSSPGVRPVGWLDNPFAPFTDSLPWLHQRTAGEVAVEAARSKIGSSYGFGDTGPDSFDCSGLLVWSYEQAGLELPRTSYDQLAAGTPVSLDELRLGDLVSFYGGDHSAIYAGDGQVIHASTSARGVVLSPIDDMPVTGARRF
ncbi:C40 family peptidase [Nocardia sp. alder85J]|nr:C40 family peptidase [Nocardia sp. alder85J]MCX4093257.1 C40 family peptidase [Nocardia sp. alder85J]